MRCSSRKLSNDKVITTACNFWRQIACSFQVMSGNILFLGNKIFEIPPFFQTRPGDLGKKVHACSLRFSALNSRCPWGERTHIFYSRASSPGLSRGQRHRSCLHPKFSMRLINRLYILLRSLPLFSDLTDCSNHMATRLYKRNRILKVRAELRRIEGFDSTFDSSVLKDFKDFFVTRDLGKLFQSSRNSFHREGACPLWEFFFGGGPVD